MLSGWVFGNFVGAVLGRSLERDFVFSNLVWVGLALCVAGLGWRRHGRSLGLFGGILYSLQFNFPLPSTPGIYTDCFTEFVAGNQLIVRCEGQSLWSVRTSPGAGTMVSVRVTQRQSDFFPGYRGYVFSTHQMTDKSFYSRFPLGGWHRAVVLGDKSNLDEYLSQNFRFAGLLHLLVVSGLHIAMLAKFIVLLLGVPVVLLRIFMMISGKSTQGWLALNEILAFLVIGAFVYTLEFPPSACRAMVLFYCGTLAKRYAPFLSGTDQVLLVASIYLAFFPAEALTLGGLLSWGAWFLVSHNRHIVKAQLWLLCLTYALVGEAALVGLIANPILVPLFGILYPLIVINALTPGWIVDITEAFDGFFLQLVRFFADFSRNYPAVFIEDLHSDRWLRPIALMACLVFFLNVRKSGPKTQSMSVPKRRIRL